MKVVYLCALVAMATCVCARTATRQPAVSAHITSLSDKDNRRKAMEHPAFANAGRQAGVEVWRIENFDPVLVPQSDRGKFYKGDSYIVLKTTADKKNKLSWDIHYWLGAATSQDEAGAAAILTVGLDDKFGGAAVQHRETQGYESQAFMSMFQPAIRYLDGGHASGFSHVTTNAGAEKRLFQVKGKRNVRVRQVDPLISSMNKGDVFILDVGHDIYVYAGEKAKNVEKLKAISVANQIRDQDHNGRAKIDNVDQYSSEADVQKFFAALGSGSRDLVPDESTGGDDQAFERSEEQTVVLSEISDSSGSLKVTPLPRPYTQEQLKPQECYILDTVSGSIYVWVGKQATEREKTEAMNKAQQYLNAKNYPAWVHVSRVPQNAEPAAFKQYFATWRDIGMKHSRIVRSASDEELDDSDDEIAENRAKLIGKSGTARGFMPDAGQGDYIIYRIENMSPVQLMTRADNKTRQLFQGDSYVIRYEANDDGRRSTVVYYWVGKDSTVDEQAAAAIFATQIDSQLNGTAIIVRAPQGEEPKHFLKIFNGRLVIHFGGKASGFTNTKQKDQQQTDGVVMYRIHGTSEDLRAEQVEVKFSNLENDDVFLLRTPEMVYLWYGKGSSDTEREGSEAFVHDICGARAEYTIVHEGEETEQFKKYLAGSTAQVRPSAWRDRLHSRLHFEPRLVDVDLNEDNTVSFEEISEFKQSDMSSDDVYVLDTGDEIYVWLGREAPRQMRKSHTHIGEQYFLRFGRKRAVVIVVKEGLEPELFTRMFPRWDPQLTLKRQSYLEEREKVLRMNAF